MSKIFRVSILLAVLATIFTCGENPAQRFDLTFEDFTEAGKFRVSTPGVYVFRDDDSWSAFGDEYWTGDDSQGPGFPLPEVNFENEMVIGLFWGVRANGCYFWVDCLEDIFIDHNVIEMRIAVLPELGECASPVWPMQVVKLKRYDLPLELHGHIPGGPE